MSNNEISLVVIFVFFSRINEETIRISSCNFVSGLSFDSKSVGGDPVPFLFVGRINHIVKHLRISMKYCDRIEL